MQIQTLIEHKCKQMGKTSFNGKCNAIHLEQWMKGQLDDGDPGDSPVIEPIEEEWTEEMLRKRSEELQLIDSQGNITEEVRRSDSRTEEIVLSDQEQSPSKSTTTESQVTVRSSPIVPETVQVCRQCHKNCLSHVVANNKTNHINHFLDCSSIPSHCQANNQNSAEKLENEKKKDDNDWQPLLLLGLCANPVASLVKLDPFQNPTPKISVAPPTLEISMVNGGIDKDHEIRNSCDCPNESSCRKLTNNVSSETDISPEDWPQTEEHPYHSLSSSALTLRRFGTVSSLERFGSEDHEDVNEENLYDNNCSSEESDLEDEEEDLGIDNEAFNHSSIMSWTARAGSFVAEKMSFFEKLGEDYRSSGGFFDRYLKSPETQINGEEAQEEETSGGTSGEEVWGTPTSGGDLDDPLNSPNYEGKLSPNDGSISSENLDDTEIMMDELLMAPPITGAILRGLLPRRTLEPLIEEDFSETSSSSPSSEPTSPPSGSSEQGNQAGSAADICSRVAAELKQKEPNVAAQIQNASTSDSGETTTSLKEITVSVSPSNAPPAIMNQSLMKLSEVQKDCDDEKGCSKEVVDSPTAHPSPSFPRSESYRRIVEAADDAVIRERTVQNTVLLFDRFRPAAKFVNIERVPRSRSIRIFDFFNVRRTERRIYERYPENRYFIKMFSKENVMSESVPTSYSQKPVSPKRLKDKQLDRRFWKQLSKRRSGEKSNTPA